MWDQTNISGGTEITGTGTTEAATGETGTTPKGKYVKCIISLH